MKARKKVITNIIWRFLERGGAQFVSFVVSIILARLLLPSDYSILAISVIVISIFNVFIDSGLGNSLIQKKDCDELDFSTVFWANLVFCFILYAVNFCVVAPIVAIIYEKSILKPVIRVMGLSIIISSIKNVQQAYVSRRLQFKKFFFATLWGTLVSAILGIAMALGGWGVWALVVQYVTNVLLDTIVLYITVDWRPRFIFSVDRLKVLLSFGWGLLVSNLMTCVYDNVRQLLIGKVYNAEDLAFYNKGKQFPSLLMVNINTSIDSVLFPVMSEIQEEQQNLKNLAMRSITTSSFILFPLLFGLAAVSDHMVPLLLTDKWNNSINFIRIFCLFYTFHPIQLASINIIKAKGKSELFLKTEIIQIVIGVILLVPVIKMGPLFIAIMYLVSALFNSLIIGIIGGNMIDYSIFSQYFDILPYYSISFIMAVVTWLIGRLSTNHMIIVLQVFVGIIVYTLLSIVFKPIAYRYVVSILKERHK